MCTKKTLVGQKKQLNSLFSGANLGHLGKHHWGKKKPIRFFFFLYQLKAKPCQTKTKPIKTFFFFPPQPKFWGGHSPKNCFNI